MGWSFGAGKIAGIPIRVHATFGLILILGAAQWGMPYGGRGAIFGVLLTLAIFFCVTLHELGHALAARYFGVKTREIVLFPLGGVAVFDQMPRRPLHELVVAIAGPLVNVLLGIGIGLAAAMLLMSQGIDPRTLSPEQLREPSFINGLLWLMGANIALVLFNLIPAFPLDGGRIVRAVLAMVLPATQATRIAASIGQLLAIGIALFGIFTLDLILVLVAVFIYLGASQEKIESQAGTLLAPMPAGMVYNRHALTLGHGDRISTVVEYMLTSYQTDFAVVHAGQLMGIVTREDVIHALETAPAEAYVAGIMRRDPVKVSATSSLDEVRQTMATHGTRVVAVYEGATYLGLLSSEDIAEVYSLRSAQQRRA